MTKPHFGQLIPATIIDCDSFGVHSQARIQRADKPRTTKVAAAGLAYRGFCASCEVPAVVGQGGRLECPSCEAPPVEMPPPDQLAIQWFPLDRWRMPMIIRRAAEHPDWSYWATVRAASDTVDAAYHGMLARLGLAEPARTSIDDIRNWRRNYDAVEQLKFYAMLDLPDGFHATYQEIQHRQAGGDIRALFDELTRDTLPTPRPVFIPIDITRIADDSEPDGECQITRWLARQFAA